ncbi:MAG: response regulator, partial [Deltaproteobacteria bacterium]|nr:response regulator [Deltaproteobacteria bacterium]
MRVIGETLSNAIERKRFEKEQENLQKKLSEALEIAHLGPYEFDFKKGIFIFNDHFFKIFRTTTAQMGGNTMPAEEYFRRFVHPDDLPFLQKNFQELLESGKPGISRQHEHRIFYSDGTTGHLSIWQFIEKDTQGNPIRTYGVIQDITERKLTEKRLRESEEKLARSRKMESLGLLAGGVAHDLNNVLSGIVSYPELLLLDLPEDSKLRRPIKTIQESGNRAVAIVQDLLTIARGVASAKEPLNLNTVIKDYLNSPEFLKLKQYYPSVRVKTDLDTELLNISGSPIHLGKVIMNLISNASEAIEKSGNIKITTCNRYLDMPLRGYQDVNTGEYAVLTVYDDGPGIPEDSIERIFEPFFSKKHIGRSGTGLGLAVVWNILQDHEGYVNVSSNEKSTTFELYFPITRDEILKKDTPISIEQLKGHGETILVVDDVESQREISCSILSVLDYRAVAVSSGEDAVEYLKENPVDLILLDMIMPPGINGRETYERIISIKPHQKALIVSGLAETDEVKKAQSLGAGEYLKKPLTLERIGLSIKKELIR